MMTILQEAGGIHSRQPENCIVILSLFLHGYHPPLVSFFTVIAFLSPIKKECAIFFLMWISRNARYVLCIYPPFIFVLHHSQETSSEIIITYVFLSSIAFLIIYCEKKPLFAASTGISGSGGGGDDDDGFSSLGYSGSSSTSSSSSSSSSWSLSQQRFKQKKLSSFAKTGKWRWKERSNGTASSLLLQKSTNATPQQLCHATFTFA